MSARDDGTLAALKAAAKAVRESPEWQRHDRTKTCGLQDGRACDRGELASIPKAAAASLCAKGPTGAHWWRALDNGEIFCRYCRAVAVPGDSAPGPFGRDLSKMGQRRKSVWLAYKSEDDRGQYVVCFHCGLRLNRANMTVEHVIPQSRGGRHHIHNLRPACGPCNGRRGNKWIPEEDVVLANIRNRVPFRGHSPADPALWAPSPTRSTYVDTLSKQWADDMIAGLRDKIARGAGNPLAREIWAEMLDYYEKQRSQ